MDAALHLFHFFVLGSLSFPQRNNLPIVDPFKYLVILAIFIAGETRLLIIKAIFYPIFLQLFKACVTGAGYYSDCCFLCTKLPRPRCKFLHSLPPSFFWCCHHSSVALISSQAKDHSDHLPRHLYRFQDLACRCRAYGVSSRPCWQHSVHQRCLCHVLGRILRGR